MFVWLYELSWINFDWSILGTSAGGGCIDSTRKKRIEDQKKKSISIQSGEYLLLTFRSRKEKRELKSERVKEEEKEGGGEEEGEGEEVH